MSKRPSKSVPRAFPWRQSFLSSLSAGAEVVAACRSAAISRNTVYTHRRRHAALKADEAKALAMFNKGEGGFKDRDLYVFCANASDGLMTAHPYLKGELLQDIVGKKGFPLGKAIMDTAAEGKIKSVTYWWPRPGTKTPLEKHTFYTKVGDQICGVGYYK
jgi:hypothetical protein